jgi:hypothetical protein
MAHRVGSLRRTDSVAIEGIADIRRSLPARRSDANDPRRTLIYLNTLKNFWRSTTQPVEHHRNRVNELVVML